MELQIGLSFEQTEIATPEKLATNYGSGLVPVYATPAMIAFMEKTCSEGVASFLDEGNSTVGTLVNVKHLKATLPGQTITCHARLIEIEGRRLVFEVKSYDEQALIGEGTHERFIINIAKFMAKLNG